MCGVVLLRLIHHMQRSDFLTRIRANIASTGYHVTVVTGGALPRYAYTIGCTATIGAEFVFAGGELYSHAQVGEILDALVSMATQMPGGPPASVPVGALGHFSLVPADASWSKRLLLGAFDYYQQADIPVWQVVPDGLHRTLDVPDMAHAFEVNAQPVWQWVERRWEYPIPSDSMALTNLPVLFGEKVTEIMRWEADDWELFSGAGPDVPPADRRMVPLGVLIGLDKALERAVHLPVGRGLWRDSEELEWNEWR